MRLAGLALHLVLGLVLLVLVCASEFLLGVSWDMQLAPFAYYAAPYRLALLVALFYAYGAVFTLYRGCRISSVVAFGVALLLFGACGELTRTISQREETVLAFVVRQSFSREKCQDFRIADHEVGPSSLLARFWLPLPLETALLAQRLEDVSCTEQ